jgi:hypothetical protein
MPARPPRRPRCRPPTPRARRGARPPSLPTSGGRDLDLDVGVEGDRATTFQRLHRGVEVGRIALSVSPTPTQPGVTRAVAVSAARGVPAPVTGARTRWHGMRSPVHKMFHRQWRVQSGGHLARNTVAFTR